MSTIAIAAVALLPPPSFSESGRLLYVSGTDSTCGDRSPCSPTIQAAVDAAQPGDTVQIGSGTYREQISVVGKNSTADANESHRIVIEADPEAPPGSVAITGVSTQCANGQVIRFEESAFVTLRGVTITGAGGPAIALTGGRHSNMAIHLDQLRIFRNGSPSCDGGIVIARGNTDTLILNTLIYGNGRDGISVTGAEGGPHIVANSTIHGNGWNGISVARDQDVRLINTAITLNGTAPGSAGGRSGVLVRSPQIGTPARLHLLHNLVCGNRLGEITRAALDETDRGNITPTGAEGPGVVPAPGCQSAPAIYANRPGPDGVPHTVDDDFTPQAGSPLIDRGVDPRTLGLDPGLTLLLEADFSREGVRPRAGTHDAIARFDIGAVEGEAPNRAPIADAGAPRTVTEGTLLNLDGSASADPDGDALSFAWSQTAGPSVTLLDATSATPIVTAPGVDTATVLSFALRVSDGMLSASATVAITVVPANRPPVLDPIGSRSVAAGTTLTITVGATDPDADALTFTVGPAPLPAHASFSAATHVFTFTPDLSQVGSLSLTFAVDDGRGGHAVETVTITVTAGVQVAITTPGPGAEVPVGRFLVRGSIAAAGAHVGVTVNGIAAVVHETVFAAWVTVEPSTTTLVALATTASGLTATHTVTVSVSGEAAPSAELQVRPALGVAPLTVAFVLRGSARPASIELDLDGNGTVDFRGPTLEGQAFTYAQPGLYVPEATVTDAQGTSVTVRALVRAYDNATLDAQHQAAWRGFKDALRQGDIDRALTFVTRGRRAPYRDMLTALGSQLAQIDQILTDITFVEQRGSYREYEMLRIDDSVAIAHLVLFSPDEDGLWRLRFF